MIESLVPRKGRVGYCLRTADGYITIETQGRMAGQTFAERDQTGSGLTKQRNTTSTNGIKIAFGMKAILDALVNVSWCSRKFNYDTYLDRSDHRMGSSDNVEVSVDGWNPTSC